MAEVVACVEGRILFLSLLERSAKSFVFVQSDIEAAKVISLVCVVGNRGDGRNIPVLGLE